MEEETIITTSGSEGETQAMIEKEKEVGEKKKEEFNIEKIERVASDFEEEYNRIGEWIVQRDRSAYYLTHDFHPYYAAFPPEMVRRLLLKNSQEGDIFLDPFMGGGSSVVEGFLLKRRTIGTDISPFSKFLSVVKTNPINIEDSVVESILSDIKEDIKKQREENYENFDYHIPNVTSIDHWYTHETKHDLSIVLHHLKQVESPPLKHFLLVALSSIVRRVSNAKDGLQHMCIMKGKKIPDVFTLFEKKVNLMKEQMAEYREKVGDISEYGLPKLFVQDARKLDEVIKPESVDIIITSPPYGTYSLYTAIHKLSFEWLELKKPKKEDTLEQSKDLHAELNPVMRQLYMALKRDKLCFLVYGNTFRDSSLAQDAIKSGIRAGFEYKGLISCPMEKQKKRHHQKYRRYVPKDFILIFRKP